MKERTIAIYQNIKRAAAVIIENVSSSHVSTGDVGVFNNVDLGACEIERTSSQDKLAMELAM